MEHERETRVRPGFIYVYIYRGYMERMEKKIETTTGFRDYQN